MVSKYDVYHAQYLQYLNILTSTGICIIKIHHEWVINGQLYLSYIAGVGK